MSLTRNAVKCSTCLTVIESKHRHDFVRCKCPTDDTAVWVDGGLAYKRIMMGNSASWTDLSEHTPESVDTRCRTCGGFRTIQADIEGVSMGVRCPECSIPENVATPTEREK